MITLQLHRTPSVYKLPRDGRLASIVNMLQVRLASLIRSPQRLPRTVAYDSIGPLEPSRPSELSGPVVCAAEGGAGRARADRPRRSARHSAHGSHALAHTGALRVLRAGTNKEYECFPSTASSPPPSPITHSKPRWRGLIRTCQPEVDRLSESAFSIDPAFLRLIFAVRAVHDAHRPPAAVLYRSRQADPQTEQRVHAEIVVPNSFQRIILSVFHNCAAQTHTQTRTHTPRRTSASSRVAGSLCKSISSPSREPLATAGRRRLKNSLMGERTLLGSSTLYSSSQLVMLHIHTLIPDGCSLVNKLDTHFWDFIMIAKSSYG